MTRWQKFTVMIEAIGWVMLSLLVIVIGFPVAIILAMIGVVFSWIRINFVAVIAGKFLEAITDSVKYITQRIQGLTAKVNAMKAA